VSVANDTDRLVQVVDGNLGEVVDAERAVLILTKDGCGSCAAYQADIESRLERGEMEDIVFGKLALNRREATTREFKRDNPWLAGIGFLPYTLLYDKGRRVDGFAASRGSYLLERIESAFGRGA
jgi:hypothetical protein